MTNKLIHKNLYDNIIFNKIGHFSENNIIFSFENLILKIRYAFGT